VYRHTQVGWWTFGAVVAGALAATVAGLAVHRPVLLLPAALLLIVAPLLASLTIEVDGGELRHWFGPGVWRKRVSLGEIADAGHVPVRWWEGWGIRVTPRGMLYNVAGTDAVEITLRSGRRFRLGTDEPDALLDALRRAGHGSARSA
jgi:hypothetical protein